MKRRVGEIISASTTELTAGCYELGEAPDFGSIVTVATRDPNLRVFAVVANISTGSREPGGRAVVRGRDGSYDEQIYADNPDLAEVLQTELSAIVVGFDLDGAIFQYLPPQPPPVHFSVFECDDTEVRLFTARLDYFRTVLSAAQYPADELLAANVRMAHACRGNDRDFLVRSGREVARLLPDNYDRLSTILRRILPQENN